MTSPKIVSARSVGRLTAPRSRVALALLVGLALAGAGGGTAVAANTPTAAGAASGSSPTCTDSWVGLASQPLWTLAKNWSTGKVPGPTSDVCITTLGVDVLTPVSVHVHSLLLGTEEGIAMEGTATDPLTLTVTTAIQLTPGVISRMDLEYTTVEAGRIDDAGGTIFTDGTCVLQSPDLSFTTRGTLQADGGRVTLSSLPQLTDGTLTGAIIKADGAVVVLPRDVTHLVSSQVSIATSSAILDPAGHNALSGLTSVDAASSFSDDSQLALHDNLLADGDVSFGGPGVSLGGTLTQASGTLALDTVLSAGQVVIDHGAYLSTYESTIAGSLRNRGTVETSGTTTVTADYTQTKGALLDAGFGSPLEVAGTATISGALESGEAFPVTGTTTVVLTAGKLIGEFVSHNAGFVLVTETHEIEAVILPQIAVTPASVPPGGVLTVSGGSFPFGTVSIYLDSTKGSPIATAQASYFGRFSVSVTLPHSARVGLHTVIALGGDSSEAVTTIRVS